MADPHLRTSLENARAAKLASPTPGTNAGSAYVITSLLTETLLSNAADIASPIRLNKVPRGWCATEETKAGLKARQKGMEDARKWVRSAPNDRVLRRALKVTTKQLRHKRAANVH